MSEYTTDDILDMIEKLGDPSKLDLSGKDLSGINLSRDIIQQKYKSRGWTESGKELPWYFRNIEDKNLDCANLTGACFWHANLKGAVLSGAILRKANLQGCNLQEADLAFTDLRKADLSETKLQRAEFSKTKLHGAFLRGARLDKTQFRSTKDYIDIVGEEQYGRYDEAREVYRDLKANFRGLAYYDDARWAYLKECRMNRKILHGYLKASFNFTLKLREHRVERIVHHSWYWFWSWVWDFFAEYMENPQRMVYRLIVPTPLIFALLYWWAQGVTNILLGAPPVSSLDYLFFSLRTMVTLAYSDFTPVGAGQWLAPLEGALGIIFLALLGFSVAKRIARD